MKVKLLHRELEYSASIRLVLYHRRSVFGADHRKIRNGLRHTIISGRIERICHQCHQGRLPDQRLFWCFSGGSAALLPKPVSHWLCSTGINQRGLNVVLIHGYHHGWVAGNIDLAFV